MKLAALLFMLLTAGTCLAQDLSPVGLWRTIDDETGKPKALVRITESNGELSGRIEKLFRAPDQDPNPTCEKCEDARRNQPMVGMVILNSLKRDGDQYSGGQLLDPASGKIYRSRMSLAENGRKLNVRGYIGVPALGRTQIWVRE
ncbi:MAG: hypothetical protein JWP36_1110 [Paucimonas sp.]|nr:hypothetical protein [Paucimonas sp.]